MAVNDSLKEFYFSMEDKWYSFIDNVAGKVPAIGKIVDGIEEKGIPTFPLAITTLLILIILLIVILSSSGQALSVTILDENGEAIIGAEVTVFLNNNIQGIKSTDGGGKVVFFLPPNQYDLQIMKSDYETLNEYGVSPREIELILNIKQSSLTKAIALKTSTGQTVSTSGQVKYYCDAQQKITTYSNGIFNAVFDDCQEIIIESISGYDILVGRASFSGLGEVIVKAIERETGTITVSLEGENVEGVRVTLNSIDDGITKTEIANNNVVVFNDVPTKTYYVTTHDPNGNFEDYSGKAKGETKELSKNETESFNIVLVKSNASEIIVNVKDTENGQPLEGAKVTLSTTNHEEVNSKVVGATGQARFNVPENTSYIVSAEHPEYIIGSPKNISSGEKRDLYLTKATEENAQSLRVSVKDSLGEPIDNVKVTLKRLVDDTKVSEKATGASGEIEFFNLEIGTYYAYAIKNGFEGTTSISVQVAPRRQSTLDIRLDIGQGDIKIIVLDEEVQPIIGAKVKAINLITNELEEEKVTNIEGISNFSIREDKKVYFIVESRDYLDYYTASIVPDEGSTIEKTIKMRNGTGTLNATIEGVYLGESEVNRTISQGKYNVIGLIEIPQGNFNEAGFHIRTGLAENERTNLIEEDSYRLGNVMSSADNTRKGTTYTPPRGYNIDIKNLTNGNAKWIEVIWRYPKAGIYEIDTELLVENVQANTSINIWHRGWAKGSNNLRDPAATTGQELYLKAKNYILTGGTSNLCSDGFCKNNAIKTMSGKNAGRIQYINNTFTATQDNLYKLVSELTNLNSIGNAVLEIESSGIKLNTIKVNGKIVNGDVQLGSLSPNMFNQMEIDFETIKSGSGIINIKIKSNNEVIYEHKIIITTIANKKFDLEIIPKQIIPYINNTMFFEIKDKNVAVENALIEINVDGELLDTIGTNFEGLGEYTLTEPTPGRIVKIVAKKEGYDTIEIEKIVDERLLIVSPPRISEIIKIGDAAILETSVILQNGTVEKLKINKMEISGELKDYLIVTTNDKIEGLEIKSGEEIQSILKFRPTSIANRLKSPKNVDGTIRFNVTVEKANQTYSTDLPVLIRLSMPGYLDSEKCLKISNSKITFNTSTEEQTQTIELENSCTAEGTKVNLHNIKARLSEESKFGTINFSGSGVTGGNIGTEEKEISNILEKDSKLLISVKFVPNVAIDSGEQTFDIIFKGDNIPGEGETETIQTKTSTEITMSNLAKCLEIVKPAEGIIIEMAGWNLGYNRIQQSSLGAYGRTQGSYQGITQRSPYQMQQQLPFTSQTYQPQMQQYEQNRFIIKNNCATEVEINLDSDSRINVSEDKFTIRADDDETITVSSGYTLGRYNIKVNAKISDDTRKQKIETVPVIVRKLGDIDRECIKINVSKLSFNSFLYKSQKYKAYNYCYDSGITLARDSRAVTIQCDAPNLDLQPDTRYFQMGAESTYRDAYPIGGLYNSYHEYLEPQGCSGNACSLITGTRVHNQTIMESSTGTVEELTFEVMPSAQYMPQRKLFDNQTQTHGLFQNLGSVRQWATETNARTGVYGNINVQYNNQYGQSQCMSFPIIIEDDWRMLESIDSAINWGDPDARPEECVGKEQKEKSLNLVEYWGGQIPNIEYNRAQKHIYIPQPPAVQVGPAPTTNIYPQPSYMQYDFRRNQPKIEASGAKNCGLTDTLKDISYEKNHGGVKVTIEQLSKMSSGSGSLIRNTKGPNLLVEIDRSNIQYNCVYINMPVTAKLTRTISLESGTVKWDFKAIVTRPGYNYQGNPEQECFNVGTGEINCAQLLKELGDYKKLTEKYPICAQEITEERANEILREEKVGIEGCSTNYKKYGFEKINKIKASELNLSELETYCTTNFCNGDMLYLMNLKKLDTLSNKVGDECKNIIDTGDSNGQISKIYMEAQKKDFAENKYYYDKINETLIGAKWDLEKYLTSEEKETISKLESTKNAFVAIYKKVINGINDESELDDKILVKINTLNANQNMKEKIGRLDGNLSLGNATYFTLDKFTNYIDEVNNEKNTDLDLLKHMAPNTEIVKVILANGEENQKEKQLIYNSYNKLKEIHELAVENNLYLTGNVNEVDSAFINCSGIEGMNCVQKEIIQNGKIGFVYSGNTNLPGTYSSQIDFNCLLISDNTYNITLKNNEVKYFEEKALDAVLKGSSTGTQDIRNPIAMITYKIHETQEFEKAHLNTILQNGFKLNEVEFVNKTNNVLVNNDTLHKVIPVKINATIYAQEEALNYSPQIGNARSINWYLDNKKIIEKEYTGYNSLEKGITQSARTYNGIYYANDVLLKVNTNGRIVNGASVLGRGIDLGGRLKTNSTITNTKNDIGAGGEVIDLQGLITPNLDDVIRLVKTGNACIVENGTTVTYNENQLLK